VPIYNGSCFDTAQPWLSGGWPGLTGQFVCQNFTADEILSLTLFSDSKCKVPLNFGWGWGYTNVQPFQNGACNVGSVPGSSFALLQIGPNTATELLLTTPDCGKSTKSMPDYILAATSPFQVFNFGTCQATPFGSQVYNSQFLPPPSVPFYKPPAYVRIIIIVYAVAGAAPLAGVNLASFVFSMISQGTTVLGAVKALFSYVYGHPSLILYTLMGMFATATQINYLLSDRFVSEALFVLSIALMLLPGTAFCMFLRAQISVPSSLLAVPIGHSKFNFYLPRVVVYFPYDIIHVNFKYGAFSMFNKWLFVILGSPTQFQATFQDVFKTVSFNCDLLIGSVLQLIILSINEAQVVAYGGQVLVSQDGSFNYSTLIDFIGLAGAVFFGAAWLAVSAFQAKSVFKALTGSPWAPIEQLEGLSEKVEVAG